MKIMNLNSVKAVAIVLAVSNFMLMSCGNQVKKDETEKKEEIAAVVEVGKDNLDVAVQTDEENVIKTRTYKMKDKQTSIAYDLDARGVVGFDDWTDYTIVNYELENIRKSNYITTKERLKHMNYRVANLKNTIPDWLKTEEVLEDVSDIQKEYLELIEDNNASDSEMKENLEELSEKFDDLKEELEETIDRYIKIHEDAIEEFNEELKDGEIDDAIEEYNEEIKKLDKIIVVDQK
jgi:hypothetical protein